MIIWIKLIGSAFTYWNKMNLYLDLPRTPRLCPHSNWKGVCGTAVSERRTQIVADVHQFEGHIACDANSKSEIVVPIFKDDKIIGVLDIDAPITDRFDDNDKEHLEAIVKIIEKQLA